MKSTACHFSRALGSALLLAFATVLSQAQDLKNDSALRIASGPAGKIYELMVRDIQAVCGASTPVRSVASTGGLQNLSILSANESELGIVQLDTLKDMGAGDENIRNLQAVMPLHNNLLHVLALARGSAVGTKTLGGVTVPYTGSTVVVGKFSELKGRTIAVVGSAQLMGSTLERQLRYDMQFIVADSDEHALKLLREGSVQAVFTLGGWPLPSIVRHNINSGLALVEYDLAPQSPYLVVKRNYQNLEAFNRNFLAVPNVLMTRPFKVGGSMGTQVKTLQNCLRQHLDDFQEGRYQAVWKEIKDTNTYYGLPAFASTNVTRITTNSRL